MSDMYAQKRGADDIYDASKKMKGANPPSAVLHFRNLPTECTEMEMMQLGQPFGKVVSVMLLKNKTQAFMEMESPAIATQMVELYQTTPPYVRSRPVYIQFSNHQHLSQSSSSASIAMGGAAMGSGNILLVQIDNMAYPVTLDTLYQVFSKFGAIMKMITFTKNSNFQMLIQFGDANSAMTAKTMLDSQNLYSGCCTLRVQMSKLQNLTVKYNNEKSWDFTNPGLPAGSNYPSGGSTVMGMGMDMGMGMGMTAGASQGMGGSMSAGMGANMGGSMGVQGQHSAVIMVSNLHEQMVTPDLLFMLVGIYADVLRVKIMYNKQDSALVQVADATQASLAITNLSGVRLFGNELRLSMSKHTDVQMPRSDQDAKSGERLLTKDFANSPAHRFRIPGSKNFQNITSPSPTLHVSNVPAELDDEQMKSLFAAHGTVMGFRFLPGTGERKMCVIKFSSVEEALLALINTHNYKIKDKLHLRVSFSKAEF